MRKLQRYGLLGEEEQKLDFVLQLTTQKFLERRLQTKVFKLALAKSIHHARVLIKQRHIRVGKQMVNVPSYLVRTTSEKHIDFSNTSPLAPTADLVALPARRLRLLEETTSNSICF